MVCSDLTVLQRSIWTTRVMRLGRYARTLRHLRLEQLAYLVLRRLLRWPRAVPAPASVAPRLDAAQDCCLALAESCWLGGLSFRFLNHTRNFGAAIDWQAAGESRLWQYNLHYFEWLRQADCDAATARAHMLAWVAANPPFAGTGWEPYPTSLRLVNWAHALAAQPAAEVPRAVIDSIALQSAWLARNLEFQLGANHLFVNLKGLLFGLAVSADTGSRGADTARRLLARELAEQFLVDGGHYERSPMYHALLTQDLLELLALTARNPSLLPAALRGQLAEITRRALAFLDTLRTPDGSVLRFNDAVDGIAPATAALIARGRRLGLVPAVAPAGGRELVANTASGYYLVREGGDLLAIDCGPVGPDHQPGHAHCDTLSFELFFDGRRLIGNCGNFDYVAGERRAWARSTRAHVTVEVDGAEQSEVWSAFRVGRRARPLGARLEEGGGSRFEGAHDGYWYLPGRVTHRRVLEVGPDFELRVEDSLSGAGEHCAVAWFHFEPGLQLEAEGRGYRVCDGTGTTLALIDGIVADSAELRVTPRYPAFGRESSGQSLALHRAGHLPLALACSIRPARAAPSSDRREVGV